MTRKAIRERSGRPISDHFLGKVLEDDLERRSFVITPGMGDDFNNLVVTTITASATLNNEDLVLIDCTNRNITITLPLADGKLGKRYWIKRIDSAYTHKMVIEPSSNDKIDDDTSLEVLFKFDSPALCSDGVEDWYLV